MNARCSHISCIMTAFSHQFRVPRARRTSQRHALRTSETDGNNNHIGNRSHNTFVRLVFSVSFAGHIKRSRTRCPLYALSASHSCFFIEIACATSSTCVYVLPIEPPRTYNADRMHDTRLIPSFEASDVDHGDGNNKANAFDG